MTRNEAVRIFENMGVALRKNRDATAQIFLDDPDSFEILLELVFEPKFKYHHKASWILEIVLEHNLSKVYPYLDYFCSNLKHIKNDSSVRALAKICRWITLAYVKRQDKILQKQLTKENALKIIETGFDWMIGNYNVAPKAYTMDTLYYFGALKENDFEWIHEELQNIILQQINEGTTGYKSHGEKILNKLKK